MAQLQQSGSNPRHILALFPDILPPAPTVLALSSFNTNSAHLQRIPESQLMRALSAIMPFLLHLKSRLQRTVDALPDAASVSTANSFSSYLAGARGDGSMHSSSSLASSSAQASLAVREREIEAARDGRDAVELLALVDTMLLKAYLLTDERLVMPFLMQPNRAYIDDAVVRPSARCCFHCFSRAKCCFQCLSATRFVTRLFSWRRRCFEPTTSRWRSLHCFAAVDATEPLWKC